MSLSDAAGYAPAEQRARMLIDRQLNDAGWIVQDKNSVNLYAALGVAVREVVMAPGCGRVDYLFYVEQKAPELVGTTAIYNGPTEWAIFPDLLIRLRVNSDLISADYLSASLRTETAHRYLRAKAKGLAGTMPKIDRGAIASTHIPVIPVPEKSTQLTTVKLIAEVEARSALLTNEVERAQRRCQALRQAPFQVTFTGKLSGRSSDLDRVEEMATT